MYEKMHFTVKKIYIFVIKPCNFFTINFKCLTPKGREPLIINAAHTCTFVCTHLYTIHAYFD